MVEKYLTKGFEQLGDDIEIVDVNPAIKRYAMFAVPADANLPEPKEPEIILEGDEITAHGGVYLNEMKVQIVLKSSRSEPVNITRIDPVLVGSGCSAPLGKGWGYLNNSEQGAGSALVFRTWIDAQRPVLERIGTDKGKSVDQPDYFGTGGKIEFLDGETIVLQMSVLVKQGFCRFAFQVDYVGPDGRESMKIDDHGKPFAVSSFGDVSEYSWWTPHGSDRCLTRDGRRAKLTQAQRVEYEAIQMSGGSVLADMQRYCAEVGVP